VRKSWETDQLFEAEDARKTENRLRSGGVRIASAAVCPAGSGKEKMQRVPLQLSAVCCRDRYFPPPCGTFAQL